MRKIAIIVLLLAAIIAPTALLVGQGGGAGEARINARKLEDGRIEFAMQVREGAGWSERLLQRGRYFPANAEVGRWLSSSPVSIDTAFEPIGVEGGTHGDDIHYSAKLMGYNYQFTTTVTTVAEYAEGDDLSADRPASLLIYCTETQFETWGIVHGRLYGQVLINSQTGSPLQVPDVQYEDVPANARMTAITVDEHGEEEHSTAWYRQDLRLDWETVQALRHYDVFVVAVIGFFHSAEEDQVYIVAFNDIDKMFQTPVQPNIDRCGEY